MLARDSEWWSLFYSLHFMTLCNCWHIVSAERLRGPTPKVIYFYPSLLFFHLLSFPSVDSTGFHLWKKGDIGMMADYDQANKAHPPLSFLWAINMTTGWLCCRVSTCIIQHLSAEMTPWLAVQADCWQQHLCFNGKSDKRKCHSLLPILLPLVNQWNWLLGV